MTHQDVAYLQLLEDCIVNGSYKLDRTGVGSHSVFGRMIRYNLWDYRLPMLTTKKMVTPSFTHEMLWFISGDTNIRYLKQNNVSIWDSWLIKGTEEYVDLTLEEIEAALYKHFDVKLLTLKLVYPDEIENASHHFLRDWLCLEAGTLSLSRKHFSRQTEEFTRTLAHYKQAYQLVMGKPAKRLVAGDIGKGGYGAQWRYWEDTRIVADRDLSRYEKQGYRKVVKIPATSAWGKSSGQAQTVVTREIDQLANVIETLRNSPEQNPKNNYNSRRKIVTAWNPGKIEDAALPPCHLYFQFHCEPLTLTEITALGSKTKLEGYTELLKEHMVVVKEGMEIPDDFERNENANVAFRPGFTEKLIELRARHGEPVQKLSCLLLLRSNDVPLGHPFNIAQYGLLTHMVAQCCNMVASELIWVGADTHIYSNQIATAEEQLERIPYYTTEPRVHLNPNIKNIDDFRFTDITVTGYDKHWPFLKYEVAV